MPELPEVETTVRALRAPLVGRTVTGMRNDWQKHLATPALPEFRQRIAGKEIRSIGRRGKYLVFHLSEPETLLIHLKMTGHLAVVPADEPASKHIHTIFELDNGAELRFRDERKFGRVYLLQDPQEVLGRLGPEPLSDAFTPEVLHQMLQGRKRILKPLLLDQTFVAGIGNIYADEALYYAKIRPTRISNTLSDAESSALHAGIQKALNLGINNEGASIDNYRKPDGSRGEMQNILVAYGRAGEPCRRCGSIMERIVLGSRSTYFCPNCQFSIPGLR
ncbi:MAG: bifunctional DNA-formamidopyrimidine glycosylase/DNA-(apurinic or apyrimidinic site) lyase [Candidatus Promineifilaceae bacterium]